MKILFLTPRVPHARSVGGLLIAYHRIRRLLERGHRIGLSFLSADGDEAQMSEWESLGVNLRAFPMPRPLSERQRLWHDLAHPIPTPFRVFRSRAMMRGVGDMVEQKGYELVVAEFALMGQYLHHNPWLPASRRIVSSHHCVLSRPRGDVPEAGFRPAAFRAWHGAKRHRRFELDLFRSMDRILVFTPEERIAMLSHVPDLHVNVVPCGVDTEYFQPAEHPVSERRILFTGNYSDASNRDAVEWFVERVWPELKRRHPDLVFHMVGPEPTDYMTNIARDTTGIEVVGEVEDVRPFLNQSRIYICPVRKGSGMRMKILEAMAAGVPVVCTTLASQGIPVQAGKNCVLADDPRIMIDGIDLLLKDTPLCASIARQARDMVAHRFTWSHSIELLERIFGEVMARR